MSYSIIAAILLTIIGLSTSITFSNNERNVLARFYSDFAQLYRSATVKSYVDQEQTIELYQFFFTEKEYSRIAEDSLTMLYTNVIERTVTYHPMPNFEVIGSRYFYRRDPKQNYTIEIELVNSENRLFREVEQPNRYFYLSSFEDLEYSNKIPVIPYYEVTFMCNASFPTNPQTQSPLLSYIDKSFQYTPRYLLDLPSFNTGKQCAMYAYADIHNNGEQSIVVKGAELIGGYVSLYQKPFEYLRTGLSYGTNVAVPLAVYKTDASFTRPLGEQASGTYVYQLSLPSPMTLPPYSVKSVQFFQTNVTIEPFVFYSSLFSPVNSNGKLLNAYNLTSLDNFLPNGRLLLREQGRFIGEIDLPNLSMDETYTMIFDFDADISYHRQVQILEGDKNSDSTTYYVEYIFENSKSSHDVRVYFVESFSLFTYFQIQNISTSMNNKNIPDLVLYGTALRGYMFLPHQHGQKTISYNLIVYKFKPTIYNHEQ